MKYIDEYRDGEVAQTLAAAIRAEADPARSYHFMEFCGGHTHAISRYGVSDLLPANVKMIHGPGCPVCVLPIGRIDQAIRLALDEGVTLCTYADTLRVPASAGLTMLRARAQGADIRMVYSAAEALALARREPGRQVVFFAIGFETTTPPTALVIRQAAQLGLTNFSVLSCHVLTPSAITAILESPEVRELGTVPLAAMALVFPFAMLTQMMSNGAMGGGVSSAISRALGAGDRAAAEQARASLLAMLHVFGLRADALAAGARLCISSLWNVDDRLTATLMERFYEHLVTGVPTPDALRLAQLDIRAEHPDPRFWAAWVVEGG